MKLFDRLFPDDQKARIWALIDPDATSGNDVAGLVKLLEKAGVSVLLVGGSFLMRDGFDDYIGMVKSATKLPVVIFPGSGGQVSRLADGILFTSLLSGRNPQYLIGEQVRAAPLIKRYGLESIPAGYLLIESGRTTSAEYVSDTRPIPRDKPALVAAHAQAAELFGMKMVYLEAGSGAEHPVPPDVIAAVVESVTIPVVVGGGIRSPEQAREAAKAGVRGIVVGTFIERSGAEAVERLVEAATAI